MSFYKAFKSEDHGLFKSRRRFLNENNNNNNNNGNNNDEIINTRRRRSAAAKLRLRSRTDVYGNSYRPVSANVRIFIRLVGVYMVTCGLLFLFYQEWDYVILFLKGPKVDRRSNSFLPESNYRPPEVPRPPREDVANILSPEEKQALKTNFETLQKSTNMVPCRLHDNNCFDKQSYTLAGSFSSFFRSTTNTPRVLLYNPLPEDRYYCGKRIKGGNGTIEITDLTNHGCPNNPDTVPYIYSRRPPKVVTKSKSKVGSCHVKWTSC